MDILEPDPESRENLGILGRFLVGHFLQTAWVMPEAASARRH